MNSKLGRYPPRANVRSSMLWSAAADAMGWITELVPDQESVKRRSGYSRITQPVEWRRKIGGLTGVIMKMPAGSYSDDTQLRLAVSRAMRGDGDFDPEVFSKIELPVWLNYALGAGLGSKAAAHNLTKKNVSWFSNFYRKGKVNYIGGGGNGAAMRIQPHVWACADPDKMRQSVLRNSIITHGHVNGFGGAYFHALCLEHVFNFSEMPGPENWLDFARQLSEIPRVIDGDEVLSAFWLRSWEELSGVSLSKAIDVVNQELVRDIDVTLSSIYRDGVEGYAESLSKLGMMEPATRGSGIKTALSAAALAWLYRDAGVMEMIVSSVNELGSDTDTIATMAAAMSGALEPVEDLIVQDRGYLEIEAERLNRMKLGQGVPGFPYPDIIKWRAPASQSSAVAMCGDKMALAGLGQLSPVGPECSNGSEVWQWMELPFGQTVLAKRAADALSDMKIDQIPDFSSTAKAADPIRDKRAPVPRRVVAAQAQSELSLGEATLALNIDELVTGIVEDDFSPRRVGEAFIALIDRGGGIEVAAAFAGAIARARMDRNRKVGRS